LSVTGVLLFGGAMTMWSGVLTRRRRRKI